MPRKTQKPVKYDTIVRGTNDYIPVTFQRQVWVDPETGDPLSEPIFVPFDLTGRLAIMTVKAKEYDGLHTSNDWQIELKDESTPPSNIDRTIENGPLSPWDGDWLWRITIDCDDPTEGAEGPVDKKYHWENNYQGMYGMNPKEGRVVFRITKKMTMVKPGTYYFDVRIMEKMQKQIGMVRESRDWAPIIGTFEIQGTPTNRSAVFDWVDLTDTEEGMYH